MLTVANGCPLLTPAEMRTAEARCVANGISEAVLMERAGAAAALAIRRVFSRQRVLVLCGPGNNGGDGYVVARLLAAAGWPVTIAAMPPQSPLAIAMAACWTGPTVALADAQAGPLIIDALFGTGMTRALGSDLHAVLDHLRGQGRVVALDCPSGVDMLTGAALGEPLAADLTVAFGAMKRGHAMGAGHALSGRIVVADIGVPTDACVRLLLPPVRDTRAPPMHKFARGHALVIEGSPGRGGAARLTARAALRAGAGLVTLIGDAATSAVDAIMYRTDAEGRALIGDPRTRAVAIGPGLGDDARARAWVDKLLAGTIPLALDAGALTMFDGRPAALANATAPLIVTPHDGEFAKLFGAVGEDRIAAALAAAKIANAVVVLKGPQSVIAAPDGRAVINAHAAPGLATAGSGDVLTGIVVALLAQGMPPFDAACTGVWLHGDAGVRGGEGLIADDLPGLLRTVLAAL